MLPVEAPPVEVLPVEAPPVEVLPVEAPPVEAPPVEAPPVEAPPVEAPPVWLTLVPLEVTEPDADEPGVDELALAEVDADEVAFGLFLGVLAGVTAGVTVGLRQGVPVALGVFRLAFTVAEAVAEAVVVAVLVAVAVPVAVAVVLGVAVVVSVGLAVLLGGEALVLLAVPVVVAAGVTVGVADLLASFEGDGEELGPHAVTIALGRLLKMLLGLGLPTCRPIGLPDPSVPWTPLLLREVIPTAELSWPKAWRSGGTASATPTANTTQAAARADRSIPSRQSSGCRRARPGPAPGADEPGADEPGADVPRSLACQRRTMSARKAPGAQAAVAQECLLAKAGPDPTRARIRSSPSGCGSTWSAAACRA